MYPPQNVLEKIGDRNKSLSRQVLFNIESTSLCGLTPICGKNCILADTHSRAGKLLEDGSVTNLINEALNESKNGGIRHIMLVAKEPTHVPKHVLHLAKRWNSMPTGVRPLSIGMISASPFGIKNLVPSLVECPLSSILISIDTASSGLRTVENNRALLTEALKARSARAIGMIGVNTTVRPGDFDQVLRIGRELLKAGVDQWTLGGFCRPDGGKMISTLSRLHYRSLLDLLVENFKSCGMRVTIDLPDSNFDIVGGIAPNSWRTEFEVVDGVIAQALNPQPGYFVRVRWDGELLSLNDALLTGKEKGSYGKYSPGSLSGVLGKMMIERE